MDQSQIQSAAMIGARGMGERRVMRANHAHGRVDRVSHNFRLCPPRPRCPPNHASRTYGPLMATTGTGRPYPRQGNHPVYPPPHGHGWWALVRKTTDAWLRQQMPPGKQRQPPARVTAPNGGRGAAATPKSVRTPRIRTR
jgi:hypothetical protein